jgi:hypothetical protein
MVLNIGLLLQLYLHVCRISCGIPRTAEIYVDERPQSPGTRRRVDTRNLVLAENPLQTKLEKFQQTSLTSSPFGKTTTLALL